MSKENEEGWEDVPQKDITYDDVAYAKLPDCMCLACVFKRIWGR